MKGPLGLKIKKILPKSKQLLVQGFELGFL